MPDKRIYVLGHLIHNENYIEYLDNNNVKTVKDLQKLDKHSTVVIRTHGITRKTQEAMEKDFEVIDLTCFKVRKLQTIIKEHSEQGYFIVLTGKKDHPEMLSLVSYARDCFVIEREDDITAFFDSIPSQTKGGGRLLILSQTTGSLNLFEETVRRVQGRLASSWDIKVMDTICSITSRREMEALDIQKGVDITFVVGDEMSSNAKKLFAILNTDNKQTYFIRDLAHLKELGLNLQSNSSAQVVSSSSTPDFIEKEIIDFLESI